MININSIKEYLIGFTKTLLELLLLFIVLSTVIQLLFVKLMPIEPIYMIPFAILVAFVDGFCYVTKTEIIPIQEKAKFINLLNEVLHKSRYTVLSREDTKQVFRITAKYRWETRFLCKKVMIDISDNEAKITGATCLVNGLVNKIEANLKNL